MEIFDIYDVHIFTFPEQYINGAAPSRRTTKRGALITYAAQTRPVVPQAWMT